MSSLTTAEVGSHFWHSLAALVGAAPEVPPAPAGAPPRMETAPSGLWSWLTFQVDPNNYRPCRATDVTVSRLEMRDGARYIIKNPRAGTYLQLSQADWALWRLMDGRHNVRDLVIAHFTRYGQFAHTRVISLVNALHEQHFLTEEPVHLYDRVAAELARREPGFWGRRLLGAFLQSEFYINGLDAYFERLGRALGWIFWTPVQILFLMLAVAGLVAYAYLYLNGASIVNLGGSYALGLFVLFCANFAVLVVHEHAHALTTKHYGREVRRGGFMLYYGFPAFFVDTMDIWLEPKRARLAVTAAGPYSSMLVGAACSLAALAVPGLAGQILHKVATAAYLGAFVNLNPLLELDGYFLLIDWLEIPMLRRRSFDYLRETAGRWWRALTNRKPEPSARHAAPPRERTIFAAYGLVAAAYSVYALWLAAFFWQTRAWSALQSIWARADGTLRLFMVLLGGACLAMIGWSLLAFLWRQFEAMLTWLELRGFFDRDLHIALIILGLAVLACAPVLVAAPGGTYVHAAPPVLLALAALCLTFTALQYAGSRFRAVWWALAVSTVLLGLGGILDMLDASLPAAVAFYLAPPAWVAAGLVSLAEQDLRRTAGWERAVMVALAVAGPAALGLPVARWTLGLPDALAFLATLAAGAAPLALALLVPTLAGFAGTRFRVPWVTLAAAVSLTTAAVGVLYLMPPARSVPAGAWLRAAFLLAAALWAGAGLGALIVVRRVQVRRASLPDQPVLSDAERLRAGFAHFTGVLFVGFRTAFGRRFARDVDDYLDVLSVTANWDIGIDDGRVTDELDLGRMDVIAQGDRYREVLDALASQMQERAGSAFVRRAAAAAYDSLPWPEREALARYVLGGVAWGRELARSFASGRSDRLLLLRGVPLFAGLSDAHFQSLIEATREVRVPAGAIVAHQGQRAGQFLIVASGEIETWERAADGIERLTGELHRGAYLGKQVLRAEAGIYSATYRASVTTQLLAIQRAALAPLLQDDTAHGAPVQARVEELMLLGRMPLFDGLGPQALAELHGRMGHRRVTPGTDIVREGEPRSQLYIVLTGQVEVAARGADGQEKVTGKLGPGEHFGERSLFLDVPCGATVRAVAEPGGPGVELLTLDERTFDRLVAGSAAMAHYVEQVASGRQIATRRQLRLTGLIA